MEIDFSLALDQLSRMGRGTVALVPNFLVALAVFALFLVGGRMAAWSIRGVSERRSGSRHLGLVLGRLAQWILALVGLMVGLSIVVPTFRAGDLVQLLGISGVAIGFAFRDILQNFLAGILILVTRPFRIGDQIVFKEFEGTVEDIKTRATYVKTYDGRRAVVPNAELFTNAVVVNTAFDVRRIDYDVGIGYGDDIPRAKSIVLDAIRGLDGVLRDPPPDVLALDLAASSVLLRVRWWSLSRRADALEVQDRVISAIRPALARGGVDAPFPTSVVLFHDQTEETDGDRARQREGWPARPGEAPAPRPVGGALAAALAERREGRKPAG